MIGQKIKQRRIELGLTQEELARRLGYKDKSAINKIELNKNDINQDKLVRFAKALECDPNDLLEKPSHQVYATKAVMEYAERLMKLSPDALDNVLQYIEFMEKRGENHDD